MLQRDQKVFCYYSDLTKNCQVYEFFKHNTQLFWVLWRLIKTDFFLSTLVDARKFFKLMKLKKKNITLYLNSPLPCASSMEKHFWTMKREVNGVVVHLPSLDEKDCIFFFPKAKMKIGKFYIQNLLDSSMTCLNHFFLRI